MYLKRFRRYTWKTKGWKTGELCFFVIDCMWPHMIILLFTEMAMCGLIHLSMALCDLVCSCMAFLWFSIAFYGLLWQNIVFSRGHRSKFIWSCFYQRSIFVKIIFTANFDQMLRFLPIQESTADFSSDEMNHWIIKVFSNQLKTDIFDTFLKRFEGTAKI